MSDVHNHVRCLFLDRGYLRWARLVSAKIIQAFPDRQPQEAAARQDGPAHAMALASH